MLAVSVKESWGFQCLCWHLPPPEGTGTWPDYLVNRDGQKNEGPFGEKIARKSRNSCRVNGRGCGCTGTVDSRRNCAQSENQIQTLNECLRCHIYCAHYWPRLAAIGRDWPRLAAIATAPCAVSIGSPGTLPPPKTKQKKKSNFLRLWGGYDY